MLQGERKRDAHLENVVLTKVCSRGANSLLSSGRMDTADARRPMGDSARVGEPPERGESGASSCTSWRTASALFSS